MKPKHCSKHKNLKL